ncbi:hypothetical protein, variant [Saprolegnia diclina VS20]|uniref:5'-3' exonuclease domain-containing protein n=1 Tax=Saprolegnia diclina (strain VS20) TaxID=1156394 RepID=T0QMX4_SAPDV|nr:hypothetical protein, variant [Saprolegnia diclina VS20]EQC35180.1 hypothetical protein, variant [Saprolegnia diclina VS20]|eukprot:XP_008611464.1 hypothetical protein, variant [Saprolegnia diclina VS20]
MMLATLRRRALPLTRAGRHAPLRPAMRAQRFQAPAREFSVLTDLFARLRSWWQPPTSLPAPTEPSKRVVLSTGRRNAKTVCLVDGNNLQYFVFDPTCPMMHNDAYVGATVRFLQRLRHLVLTQQPDGIVVFFDTSKVTDRKKENPAYKSERKPMEPRLRPQFKLTTAALRALNLPIARVPGVEADDLIASYAKACVDQGYNAVIVSNDNDFLQLVQSSTVTVLKPSRNQVLREKDVRAMLHGGKPFLQPDIRALCGDRWGKTPGLPGGLNRRQAVDLLEASGGLLPLLDNLENVDDETLRQRLASADELLRTSYRNTKLENDLVLPIALSDLHVATNFDVLEPLLGKDAVRVVNSSL